MTSVLNPTPLEVMLDAQGRPYFLWDVELSLPQFEAQLRHPDPATRHYWLGKLMRQAKPDDVFSFVGVADLAAAWPEVQRTLGRTRPFWEWLLRTWKAIP